MSRVRTRSRMRAVDTDTLQSCLCGLRAATSAAMAHPIAHTPRRRRRARADQQRLSRNIKTASACRYWQSQHH